MPLRHIAIAALCLGILPLQAQTQQEIDRDYAKRQETVRLVGGDKQTESHALDAETRRALKFLYAYMPLPDMTGYSPAYFAAQAKAAVRARHEMPWGSRVPEREWLHFVLPVRVNNENLDTFRTARYEELKRRVEGMTMKEAVLEVNHWCHEYVTYQPSDSRTSSPLASMKTGTGRCGEESTFTVAALRAIGIPARQVYTPRWAHTDDNHAWVEAWVDGKWHFLGACEPEAVLDLGWFNQPASRGILMHTNVYGRYDGPEDVISRTPISTVINVTSNYAPTARQTVIVTDEAGNPIQGARIDFKLYNYAELYTVQSSTTDRQGKASITSGLGDLVAWASDGKGRFGFTKFTTGKEEVVKVVINHKAGEAFSQDLDIVPPKGRNNIPSVPAEAAELNNRRKAQEDSIRNAYIATFMDSARAAQFCADNGLDAKTISPILIKSRGNHAALQALLVKHKGTEKGVQLTALLQTLTDKDLRDFDPAVIENHLAAYGSGRTLTEVEKKYVLCPRISTEMLSPWRGKLSEIFGKKELARFAANPESITAWIKTNIAADSTWNPSRLWVAPEAAAQTRTSDMRSAGLLFVAMARTAGLPARIDPITAKVQYAATLNGGHPVWTDVNLVAKQEVATKKGELRLTYSPRAFMENPGYYHHFTISKLVGGQPVLQEYPETATWDADFKKGVEVDAGSYLLTSGTRMADGSVLARLTAFTVSPTNKETDVHLVMRQDRTGVQVIGNFNSENIYFDKQSATSKSILSTTGRGYFVVALVKANHEPSNHILHDLELLRPQLEAWGRKILILFPSEKEMKQFEARRTEFPNLPSTVVFGIDEKGSVESDLTGSSLAEGGSLPVVVLADTFNRVVFLKQGYTIGIGEQLKQVISKL